jgi:hypothetical protein
MDGNTQHRSFSRGVLVLVLAGWVVAQGALATPPVHGPQPQRQSQTSLQTQHLDLRAPSHVSEIVDNTSERGFPSRRPTGSTQAAVQLPSLGTENVRARPTVQEFVRRVRQEGLPVARLFEGKSALVHLGLSPKGKPGLWLVQKTR